MSAGPRKLIGTPLPRVRRIVLGVLPVLLLIAVYAYFSHQRQIENPMDRLMPGLTKLWAGIQEITTPDKRTGTVWLWVDTIASL